MDIIEEIIVLLNENFHGRLDCEEQRADLFVYINGYEESITAVDTEMIYFENEEFNIKLEDADIQHLVYIKYILI